MNFKTWYTGSIWGEGLETISEPSVTIPGEALSVKEILQKYTRGIKPEISKVPQYEPDADFDDADLSKIIDITDTMDLTEQIARIGELQQRLIEQQAALNKPTTPSDTTTKKTQN